MSELSSKADSDGALHRYRSVRRASAACCEGVGAEDMQAQSMPDASPLKWHLAHTTWAIETFLLKPFIAGYEPFDRTYEYLFNSYYNAVGSQYPRHKRGLLTRPSLATVQAYRQYVDDCVERCLQDTQLVVGKTQQEFTDIFHLCMHHEEQHQELMLTDLTHLLYQHPQPPAIRTMPTYDPCVAGEMVEFSARLATVGHKSSDFAFDNEGPAHQVYLPAFRIAPSLVSNRQYLEFMQRGGYEQPEHWLSEAWQLLQSSGQRHPQYWQNIDGQWHAYSLAGSAPLRLDDPVAHLSYFEASAFAAWAGKRLPTESEWEVAAATQHPQLRQFFGQLWQWTSSSYSAYPGFRPPAGAIGEYNGKFMVNQYVLRGGSIATPAGHIRRTYRNFFYPGASWQFSGLRLAESI